MCCVPLYLTVMQLNLPCTLIVIVVLDLLCVKVYFFTTDLYLQLFRLFNLGGEFEFGIKLVAILFSLDSNLFSTNAIAEQLSLVMLHVYYLKTNYPLNFEKARKFAAFSDRERVTAITIKLVDLLNGPAFLTYF